MPNLVWPRTPGRDYAGIVVEGPGGLVGTEVWGTGGDLGMRRNGNHAEYAIVDAAGIAEKPGNLSMHEAGSLGVSWTCAYMGMVDGARVAEGANGCRARRQWRGRSGVGSARRRRRRPGHRR